MSDKSKNGRAFGDLVGAWWRDPVDYPRQVQYFKRAMSGAVQALIGRGTGCNALISGVVLLPSAGTFGSRVAVAVFAALQAFWAWAWCCRPWPSRRTSLAFVASADVAIAVMVLLDAGWVLGLFGLSFFSMLSVYLLFFDGARALAAHVGWIVVTTAAFAVRIGVEAQLDVVAFIAEVLLSVTLVVVTPLGVQAAIWALRNDANESVTDPLTGLLNRRGLHLHIDDLLGDGNTRNADVVVIVVDLDRFKGINDTFGHAVGDEVLVRSARRIKSVISGGALAARIGGEEFVIVYLSGPGATEHVAERVRRAVAAPARRAPVTASVGVTSVALAEFTGGEIDPTSLLEASIEHADQAMFDAKRRGGNDTVHLRLPRSA